MSRGLGTAQRRILAEMDKYRFGKRTAGELADALGMNARQVRYALRSLEKRGLVVITVSGSRRIRGKGKYGPLRQKYFPAGECKWQDALPTVIVREGEPWPGQPEMVAARDTEFYHDGMPVGVVMTAQLTESKNNSDRLDGVLGSERIALIAKLFDNSKPID